MDPLEAHRLVLADHRFTVPLDHDAPGGERIELFAREVRAAGPAAERLPWLLFLNGGPGMAAPRPLGDEGWLREAVAHYRVLLLDQRGTGRSATVDARTLPERGGPAAQAEYLARFRADSIVRDAEAVRRTLLGDEPWSVLGQSFGGFCTVTYLSFAPDGLREAFVTGGLPGVGAGVDDVHRALYRRAAAESAAHYERYPGDRDQAERVIRYLLDHEVVLPSGRRLGVEAFQSAGNLLGSTTGSSRLHHLLEDPFTGRPDPAPAFLSALDRELSWSAGSPLYQLLIEASYADGPGATAWSGLRVREEFPEFDARAAAADGAPILFTGEPVYPWTFDGDPALRPFREVADHLAARSDWPALYDADRLRRNTAPVTAAVYRRDMHVDHDLSVATAGLVAGLQAWVSDEHRHDALRRNDAGILDRLISMRREGAGGRMGV